MQIEYDFQLHNSSTKFMILQCWTPTSLSACRAVHANKFDVLFQEMIPQSISYLVLFLNKEIPGNSTFLMRSSGARD